MQENTCGDPAVTGTPSVGTIVKSGCPMMAAPRPQVATAQPIKLAEIVEQASSESSSTARKSGCGCSRAKRS